MKRFSLAFVMALMVAPAVGYGQSIDLTLRGTKSAGNSARCDGENIQSISDGGNASILFGNLNLKNIREDLKRVGNLHSRCVVEATITVPQGYYVSNYTNAVGYGIVKGKGVEAQITSQVKLHGPVAKDSSIAQKIYPRGTDADEAFAILQTSEEIDTDNRVKQCKKTKNGSLAVNVAFVIDLRAQHIKQQPTDPVFEVDSSDIAIDLEASLEQCNRLSPSARG